jgi:hypothetical protein
LTQIRKKAKIWKREITKCDRWGHKKYSHTHQCVNYNFDRNDSKNKLLIL